MFTVGYFGHDRKWIVKYNGRIIKTSKSVYEALGFIEGFRRHIK